jgi:hypothetical protein
MLHGPGKKKEVEKIRRREGKKRRLKALKPVLNEYYNVLHIPGYFGAPTDDSIHLKKPSGGQKGLIGPPCHGAPWPPEAKKRKINENLFWRFYCRRQKIPGDLSKNRLLS